MFHFVSGIFEYFSLSCSLLNVLRSDAAHGLQYDRVIKLFDALTLLWVFQVVDGRFVLASHSHCDANESICRSLHPASETEEKLRGVVHKCERLFEGHLSEDLRVVHSFDRQVPHVLRRVELVDRGGRFLDPAVPDHLVAERAFLRALLFQPRKLEGPLFRRLLDIVKNCCELLV